MRTASSSDISTPETRGEPRLEFEQSEARLEAKLDQKFKHLATKADLNAALEMWVGAIMERVTAEIDRALQELKQLEISMIDKIRRSSTAA